MLCDEYCCQVYVSGNLTLKRESGHTWWSFERDSSLARDCGSIIGPAAITVSEEVPPIKDFVAQCSLFLLHRVVSRQYEVTVGATCD
jgi:hypothetical protein